MLMKVFSVYDSAAGAYLQPFFMASRGQAIRAFTDLVNDGTHSFAKHADDYTLFELGTYDDSSGKLVSHDTPQSLGVAVEYVKR